MSNYCEAIRRPGVLELHLLYGMCSLGGALADSAADTSEEEGKWMG